MLAQWFLLLAFSTSERLHRAVCDGSQQPSHDCALASVAKSQVWTAAETSSAPGPRSLEVVRLVETRHFVRSAEDLRLDSDRGPPATLLPD